MKNYFNLKPWKTVCLLIIFVYGITQMRAPICVGGPCHSPLLVKLFSYAGSILLPGTTQLMRDNGFLIGYKTFGIWDAIPQLIFHVGLDIFFWHFIVCVIIYLINRKRSPLGKKINLL